MDKVEFTCHGYNAPAYGCSEPGDQSGLYVRAESVEALETENAALEAKAMQYDHDRNVLWGLAIKRGDAIDRLEAENAALKSKVFVQEEALKMLDQMDSQSHAELLALKRGPVLSDAECDAISSALNSAPMLACHGEALRNLLERAEHEK